VNFLAPKHLGKEAANDANLEAVADGQPCLVQAVTGGSRRMVSEEAEIEGHVVGLFACMQARVERVLAQEDQLIAQGDVLVVLEHRELDARLEAAGADLPSSPAAPRQGRSSRTGRVRPVTLSQAHAILRGGSRKAVPDLVEPAPASAQARKARPPYRVASLNRDRTNVRAPVAGRVIRRAVVPGQVVDPSRPLITLVERDDVWVLASFRKDQLVHVHTGQRATVHVGERAFDARVDGVVRAGSPVLLEFATRPDVPPRPGMSAIVAVEVG
jgi:multidrug resistance efflux pump